MIAASMIPARLVGRGLVGEPARTLLACAAVLLTLLLMFLSLLWLRRRAAVSTEVTRKLLHVGMGLIVCAFPWLFDRATPVVLLSIGSVLMMSSVKFVPFLRNRAAGVVHAVERTSHGEVYYPIAVGVLFILARGNWLLFVVPILVLALGDALAAVIGIGYGRLRYMTSDGAKSIEGSVAFFAVTFLAVHIPILLFAGVGRGESLLIALMLGILVAMLEAIAWQGLDNLFIPIGAWALLTIYLPLPADALVRRLVATLLVATVVFVWRSRSTMDDSALTAAVFYGYVVLMVGGWIWVLAPAALFLTHVFLYPRAVAAELRENAHLPAAPRQGRTHTARAIVAICAPSVFCLVVYTAGGSALMVLPHSVVFSAQIAKVSLSTRGVAMCGGGRPRLPWVRVGMLSWIVAFVPTAVGAFYLGMLHGLSPISASGIGVASFVATLASGEAFCRLLPWLYTPEPRRVAIELSGMVLTSFAAACTWLTVLLGRASFTRHP